MPTGIFFHYQQGERLKDFPGTLGKILCRDNVFFYDAFYPSKPISNFEIEPIAVETLHKVHTPQMVNRVIASGAFDGAMYSAAGTVSAAHRVFSGELNNAFVFTGYGDHHAGSDFFGGGCYFNGVALAIRELGDQFSARQFAIVDTDAHHGDGSWELFADNPNVLYLCFCSDPTITSNGNVNIQVPAGVDDDGYLAVVKDQLERQLHAVSPKILFWNWGYDGTVGEYGDIGLSANLHARLAAEMKRFAEDACGGRLIVVLCGGRSRNLATSIIPEVIEVLVQE